MIRVEREPSNAGEITRITIDRPGARNALTPDMLSAMREALADANTGGYLLAGDGAVFSAGFDMKLVHEDDAALAAMLRELSACVVAMRENPRPVVIAAHGAAVAGACALLAGADLIVTNDDAKLGYPVVRLGISPAVSAPTLALRTGAGAARARLLDPALVDAREAVRIGLASESCAHVEDVIGTAHERLLNLASKPPNAFATTKRWINEVDGLDACDVEHALDASLSIVGSDEQRARVASLWS
ncbi:MAG: enoyl-CoA hydratase/isomerase family protein [Planctomycetota bacterium]